MLTFCRYKFIVENLLTFYFTKMYFYCIQNKNNEKDNTGFNDDKFCFCSLQQQR